MDALTISGTLAELPLFSELEGDTLYLLSKRARELAAEKGDQLFGKGDAVNGFYFLLEGKVKLAFLSSRGNEKIVEIIGPGQSFGESMVLAGQTWPYYAQAIRRSKLLFIEKSVFLSALREEPALQNYLLQGMSRRICELFSQMEALCLQSSRERVVGYLLREIEQARSQGRGDNLVELPDTKANTASLLNLTPETFSRIIHNLERERIIEVSCRAVRILDLERLQKGCGC
jgi:CRP-like cAMP-binding protein